MSNSIPRIVERKGLWFGLSAILIIPGIIVLFTHGLRVGIDFKSGSVLEYTVSDSVHTEVVQDALKPLNLKTLTVQLSGDKGFIVRTDDLTDEQHTQVKDALTKALPSVQEKTYSVVGPTIGKDQTEKAIIRVIVASIGIICFIAWAFRKVPRPASSWKFGVSAVIALLHDLLFVIGTFTLLGLFIPYLEVDTLFVTALLTVMGFSVHDTIVVFDRIRENLRLNPGASFTKVANISVAQTLARSLNTSLTVILVLLALFLLGPDSTKGFTLALLLGVLVGTYSSIFNATPFLVWWQERSTRK